MPTILKNMTARVVAKADPAAEPDSTTGTFDAVVSVFGNVDSYGDVVDKGAFTDTLKAWGAAGAPIPVIWSHDWEDPFSHIGGVTKALETDQGLQIDGLLDLSNPTAAQVHKLMKSGRVVQFSFVARAAEGGWSLETTEDGDVVSHLTKLDLIEVGPTLRGANPETQLISIKSATDALNPGELASTDLDTIKSIHNHLAEVITLAEKASSSKPGGEETAEPGTPVAVLPGIRAKAIASLVGEES